MAKAKSSKTVKTSSQKKSFRTFFEPDVKGALSVFLYFGIGYYLSLVFRSNPSSIYYIIGFGILNLVVLYTAIALILSLWTPNKS